MAYYDFIMTQWQLGKLTIAQVDLAVTKNLITATEANTIKATLRSG